MTSRVDMTESNMLEFCERDLFGMVNGERWNTWSDIQPGNQKITNWITWYFLFVFIFWQQKHTKHACWPNLIWFYFSTFFFVFWFDFLKKVEPIGSLERNVTPVSRREIHPQPLPARARLLSLERHNSYDLEPASRTETDWKRPVLGPFLGANC